VSLILLSKLLFYFGKVGKHFITLWVQSNQKPRAQQKKQIEPKNKNNRAEERQAPLATVF
jgi:hypothetical protein